MPIASKRDTDDTYETYQARRDTPDGEFSDLEQITEISEPGSSTVDAFMTDDGLMIFFNREEEEGEGDLFMAWRRSTSEPFIETVPLDAVNTEHDERDPWVNAEGTRFFFSSDRGGDKLDIYMAFVQLPNVRDFPRP
jgi:WD40-like Beta Propeller Repeat